MFLLLLASLFVFWNESHVHASLRITNISYWQQTVLLDRAVEYTELCELGGGGMHFDFY